jgi:hypothetical protein
MACRVSTKTPTCKIFEKSKKKIKHPANPMVAGNAAKNSPDPVKFPSNARKILQLQNFSAIAEQGKIIKNTIS